MKNSIKEKTFETLVKKKFFLYNSLFLNLPYQDIEDVGPHLSALAETCREELDMGRSPVEIIDTFFENKFFNISEKEKLDYMFRVIQYVERQIVLYDSVEDTAFHQLVELENDLTIHDYFHLAYDRKKENLLVETLSDFHVRLVLTAHPTQFYPRCVLDIISQLRSLLEHDGVHSIDTCLQQLGMTSLLNEKKPTPFDEAKNIIYFLRSVYYDAMGDLYTRIKRMTPDDRFDNPGIVQLGFWPCGDRDGNPFVTSKITLDVADELRMTLMKCYYNELKTLEQKLTFREIDKMIGELSSNLYSAMFDSEKKLSFTDIYTPLAKVRTILSEKFNHIYIDALDALMDKVKIFKTHFASLDLRQNHLEHRKAIQAILIKEGRIKNSLDELDKDELISILAREEIRVHAGQYEDDMVKEVIRTVTCIPTIQDKNGESGCNRYIISHSEDIFSVMFVYALLKWCAWGPEKIPVDIIPLFESMKGMQNADSIMQGLFDIPEYRTHLSTRADKQTIMLGFSDGTKDGGYLAANWSIFKTKEKLTAVCRNNGIQAVFFDGRGGPPARGGGKTHRFYASQSSQTANKAIELTVQGQTITSLYGTQAHFIHNCEQLLTAGFSLQLTDKANLISKPSRRLMEILAEKSYDAYTGLKAHPLFVSYLENKTPLKYYGRINVGSRPLKRGSNEKLELKDLRAIPFVGAWSQMRQNVPGYFGIGTALKSLVDDGLLPELKKLYKDVPFFKTLILNSMMSMSKCDFQLTAYMKKDPLYQNFWHLIHDEYLLSKKLVLIISDNSDLLEEEPLTRKSIDIRKKIALPLLVIQQYAFQKIDSHSEQGEVYEKIIQRAMVGNINASRNSA